MKSAVGCYFPETYPSDIFSKKPKVVFAGCDKNCRDFIIVVLGN
jgi:hypothetical protein